jgi:type II secretory pathway pseudopilin PulG
MSNMQTHFRIINVINKWLTKNGSGKISRGFTLIELTLYMGIFSILLLVLTQLFTGILSVRAESMATSTLSQDEAYIMSRLTYDIHQASQITFPSLGISGSTLHLTGSTIDHTYSIQNGTLILTDNTTGTTAAVSGYNSTAAVAFVTIGNSDPGSKVSVSITLTLTSKTLRSTQQPRTRTVATTVQTR